MSRVCTPLRRGMSVLAVVVVLGLFCHAAVAVAEPVATKPDDGKEFHTQATVDKPDTSAPRATRTPAATKGTALSTSQQVPARDFIAIWEFTDADDPDLGF